MSEDLDDTIVRPVRPEQPTTDLVDGDTIVRRRPDLVEPGLPVPGQVRSPRPVSTTAAPTTAPHSDTVIRAVYSFIVNRHEPIGLDRPAIIGRAPRLPRVPRGPRPRLVRVPSPHGEVSSVHLELHQEGSLVVVTDLGSTNGTMVRIPGQARRRLRSGESLVVLPGSLVDIGDGNLIEILPIQRSAPEASHTAERST